MSLKKENIKALVEIAASLAVVVSLIFVGLGVRETARQTALNTQSVQITAYQNLIFQISEFNKLLLDTENAELYNKMRAPGASWDSFTEIEQRKIYSILFLVTRHSDLAFYQYEKGLLSYERFRSVIGPLSGLFDIPLVQERWNVISHYFTTDFRNHIDSLIYLEIGEVLPPSGQ